MPDTFIKIASVTVGSGGASSIDFTSIPSTYTDLCLKVSARNSTSFRQMIIRFNNSSADFTLRNVLGDGSTVASYNYSNFNFNLVGYNPLNGTDTTNTFGNIELYFPNYAGSANKSVSIDAVMENNATISYSMLQAGLWSQTAAINQLTLLPFGSTNFAQYSTATIYGIKNS